MIFIICVLTIPNIAISRPQNWINSFIKYEQTMSIPVPNGYLLKSDPSLEANDIPIKQMDNSLLAVGHVDVDGQRFYMTEWSWSQYLKGKNPNWVLLLTNSSEASNQDLLNTTNGEFSNQDIINIANAVLTAFKNQDGKALATLVHPTNGVRFSHSSVNIATDRVLSRANILRFWTNPKIYYWGDAEEYDDDDGGDYKISPIKMRSSEYCKNYILIADFLEVQVNEPFHNGHTNPKLIEDGVTEMLKTYPGTTWVEYRNFLSSLRFLFERVRGKLFLVGILSILYSWI